jgi:hypothetical protein
MCMACSSLKHNRHTFLPVFLIIPFNFHPAASPLLSFLEQHSIHVILPQLKFVPQYNADELRYFLYNVLTVHVITSTFILLIISL